MDSTTAITEMDALINRAGSEGDHALEALVLCFKGRFYDYRFFDGSEIGIKLMRKAVGISEQYGTEMESASLMNHLGFALCKQMNYSEGLEYLLKSNYMMRQIGYENIPEADVCLYKLARVYFDFGNYDKVIDFLSEVLKYGNERSPSKHAANNLLCAAYAELGQIDKAMEHIEKAKYFATLFSDTLGIGSAICNLGLLYCEKGDTAKGMPLLEEAYILNSRNGIWFNAISALMAIAEIDMEQGRSGAAREKLRKISALIKEHRQIEPKPLLSFYRLSSKMAEKENNFKLANAYRDSLIQFEDSIRKKRDMRLFSNLSVQIAAENYLSDIQLLEKDKTLQKVIRNAVIAISVLVIFILSGLWYYAVMKRKKEHKTFIDERNRAMNELEGFRRRVKEKNNLIEDFRLRLELLGEGDGGEEKENIMQRLDRFIILTEDDWLEFKRVFDKVYPHFLKGVQLKFPDLTASEIRLLALIKLNLSVAEMANTLGILPQSVRKTRQRLMKKLNIEHHRELPSFVEEFR